MRAVHLVVFPDEPETDQQDTNRDQLLHVSTISAEFDRSNNADELSLMAGPVLEAIKQMGAALMALAPPAAHAGAEVDAHALACRSRLGLRRGNRPGCGFEVMKNVARHEACARSVDM